MAVVEGEEGAAEAEAGYGDAGADPAVIFGGGDEAESQVDCVAFIVAVSVGSQCWPWRRMEDLPVCILTKLPQMNTLALSSNPVMI